MNLRSIPRGARALTSGATPMRAVVRAVGASIVVVVLNVLTGILTARLLGPEGRGIFVAVTLWQQLLAVLAVSGIQSALVVLARQDPAGAGRLSVAAAFAALVSSSVLVLLGLFFIPLALADYPRWVVLTTQACLLVTPINALHMVFKQSLAGIGAFRAFNALSVLPPALFLGLLILFGLLAEMTALVAIVALAVTAALGLAISAVPWARALRPALPRGRAPWRGLWGQGVRSAGADLVVALASYTDRLILIPLVTGAELGLYVVAYSFSRLLLVILPAIESVVFSNMAGRTAGQMKELHDRAFRMAAALLLAMLAGLWLVDTALIRLFYGREFVVAAALFRILSIEAALTLLGMLTMRYLIASGRPALASGVQLAGFVVSSVLILGLAVSHGVLGAAWGMTAATGLKLVIAFVALRRRGEAPPRLLPARGDLRFILDRL